MVNIEQFEANRFCAYVLELFDASGNLLWVKIGKANDLHTRCKQHLSCKGYRKEGLAYIEVKEVYYAENEDDAMTIENELRKHYKARKDANFVPKDRFSGCRHKAGEFEANERLQAFCNMLNIEVQKAA